MKPIKLTIQAFQSYLDKTEIDFTKLGDKGLFLVDGETGAGKSTIFQAIYYALYKEFLNSGGKGCVDIVDRRHVHHVVQKRMRAALILEILTHQI